MYNLKFGACLLFLRRFPDRCIAVTYFKVKQSLKTPSIEYCPYYSNKFSECIRLIHDLKVFTMCYSGLKNGLLPLRITSQKPGDHTRLYEVFAVCFYFKWSNMAASIMHSAGVSSFAFYLLPFLPLMQKRNKKNQGGPITPCGRRASASPKSSNDYWF